MRKAIRNGKVCKPRHALDLEKYPTYVISDFIKGKMLAPDFRWAFVSWIPGSRMTISTCPKCYGDGIVGEHAELCDLCLGKGYVPKNMADKFVDLMIQLSEVLMEVEGE